jgi:hypothetical protein
VCIGTQALICLFVVLFMHLLSTTSQFVVLANLESLNAQFIKDGLEAEDRLLKLNNIAIEQLQLLLNYSVKKIEKI